MSAVAIIPEVISKIPIKEFILIPINQAPISSYIASAVAVLGAAGSFFLPYIVGGVAVGAAGAGLYLAGDAAAKSPLGTKIFDRLAGTWFPTDEKSIPGVQTLLLYWGDTPEASTPNRSTKANSGYDSQLAALAGMSEAEIKDFLGDFIGDVVADNVNSAGEASANVDLNGITLDPSKIDDLKDEISGKIKAWAEAKQVINNTKIVEQGTGDKPGVPAVIPIPGANPDDQGRPAPGSPAMLSGKPELNLCAATMIALGSMIATLLAPIIESLLSNDDANFDKIQNVLLGFDVEGDIRHGDGVSKNIAEFLRDSSASAGGLTEESLDKYLLASPVYQNISIEGQKNVAEVLRDFMLRNPLIDVNNPEGE